jgi:hypothetical protein
MYVVCGEDDGLEQPDVEGGVTTSVSVSDNLISPSMLLILLRRYLPLYRGRLREVTVSTSVCFDRVYV